MNEIGVISQWAFELFGMQFVLNKDTLIMTWIVMVVLILFALLASRQTKIIPNPLQSAAELIVGTWADLVDDSLAVKESRKYFPLVCTVFLLVWISNLLGIIPFLSEPTADLNTTLSLGLVGFLVAHYSGIKFKGFKAYAKGYFEPIFFMMPLNLIGELAKIISISFRLFGNIMGAPSSSWWSATWCTRWCCRRSSTDFSGCLWARCRHSFFRCSRLCTSLFRSNRKGPWKLNSSLERGST